MLIRRHTAAIYLRFSPSVFICQCFTVRQETAPIPWCNGQFRSTGLLKAVRKNRSMVPQQHIVGSYTHGGGIKPFASPPPSPQSERWVLCGSLVAQPKALQRCSVAAPGRGLADTLPTPAPEFSDPPPHLVR